MLLSIVLVATMGLLPKPILGPTPAPVTLRAADGVNVYGNTYSAFSPTQPVILLFHQAGSSKDEYAQIAPRLVQLGYNAIAIDQRSGGEMYGPNQTASEFGKTVAYPAVLPDMEAALAWAERAHPNAKIFAWGSSYSAALVFALAARHPKEIAAVLAFSPGEYMDDKHFVQNNARRVHMPVFIDSGSTVEEINNAKAVYAAVASRVKVEYVPKNGIHGASTLREDRDADGYAENWDAVTAFLKRASS